jgi:hypothetical protein
MKGIYDWPFFFRNKPVELRQGHHVVTDHVPSLCSDGYDKLRCSGQRQSDVFAQSLGDLVSPLFALDCRKKTGHGSNRRIYTYIYYYLSNTIYIYILIYIIIYNYIYILYYIVLYYIMLYYNIFFYYIILYIMLYYYIILYYILLLYFYIILCIKLYYVLLNFRLVYIYM